MQSIQSVERLDLNSVNLADTWKSFRQNFEINLMANELHNKPERVKVAIFLSAAGPETVKVYNSFKLKKKAKYNLTRVIDEFEKYCTVPRRNQLYDTYLFEKRRQAADETFHSFVDDLKRMIKFCGYEHEERMLRDRIVFGVLNRKLQKKYIACRQLDLNQTIEMGCAVENKRGRNLVQPTGKLEAAVQSGFKLCGYCNFRHGRNMTCPAVGKLCIHCNKSNHYASVCREKRQHDNELLAYLTAQFGRF